MKITIKEIAEEAGVSMTTVSNVINKKDKRASKETIELIENIIKKYDYSPNLNARSLVQSSSRLIGLLYFSTTPDFSFADPFVSQILASIEREAKENGYFIFVNNITSGKDILSIQNNWKFEGFIIVGVTSRDFQEVHSVLQVPSVYIDTYLSHKDKNQITKDDNCIFVNSNDSQASRIAVEYLIENGHENIAFLSYDFNPNYTSVIEQRYKSFLNILDENKISFIKDNLFLDNEFNRLIKKKDTISAVFVSSDFLAAQLIKYLKVNNVFSTWKLSIISVDNTIFSELIDPPLTTIDLNPNLKGQIAFESLLKIINNEDFENNFIELDGKLIIRETVTPRIECTVPKKLKDNPS